MRATKQWNGREWTLVPMPQDIGHTANAHHLGLFEMSKGAQVLSAAAIALGAYHGYKRTGSTGWAVGWALLSGVFPVIAIPVAFAQGFGRKKGS